MPYVVGLDEEEEEKGDLQSHAWNAPARELLFLPWSETVSKTKHYMPKTKQNNTKQKTP